MVRLSGIVIAENIRQTTQSACRVRSRRFRRASSVVWPYALIAIGLGYFVLRASM